MRAAPLIVVAVVAVGRASLIPERMPLSWRVEDVKRTDGPAAGDVTWRYTLVIENPGRLSFLAAMRAAGHHSQRRLFPERIK